MGILCLTECTKNIVPESPENSPALTGVIAEEVNSKTALEGVDVSWVKDDRIAVQLSDNHRENASSPKAEYATVSECINLLMRLPEAKSANSFSTAETRKFSATKSFSHSIRLLFAAVIPQTDISILISQ